VRVAVTGAGGLIGRALVRALASEARVEEVVAIDVRAQPGQPVEGVSLVRRDTRDPGLAADLEGVDALVHLAFRVLDRRDARAIAANVDGSRNAFEAAIAGGAVTIVHASSAAVYGAAADNPVPLTEDRPLRPAPGFAYPQTKVAVEEMLDRVAARAPHVRCAWLRPTNTLAPGSPLLLGHRVYVTLRGFDPPMQFTWVDDVAAAFAAALHAPSARGPVNVGAPGTVLASEVAATLGVRGVRLPYRARRRAAVAMRHLGVPGGLHPGFVDMARYPIVVSSRRAETALGWRPALDTAGALRRFAETLP
jgi:nucleoside-diphosphate-sugar epimerase